MNSFTLASIANKEQFLNTGSLPVPFSAASISNLACAYTVTYTATYKKNGVDQAQPSFITFTPASLTFSSNPTDAFSVGVWTVILMASIPQPSLGASAVKQVTTSFTINVKNQCDTTTIIDKTFSDMAIKVTLSTTQDISFKDSFSTSTGDELFCGPRVITWTGGLPAYLAVNAGLTTLTLSTSNPAHAGVYNLQFTVTLQNYATVTPLVKNFKVTITCEVFTLAFATAPVNILFEPGITADPSLTPFVMT